MDIVVIGLLLGGTYALIAIGLQLQYGVARIMNLANGELLVAGSFGAFWFFSSAQLSPLLSLFIVTPLAFVFNWLIYQYLIRPLVRRAKNRGQLEVDSILATFGLSFIFVGLMTAIFGGEYFSYSYLEQPFNLLNQSYGLNRIAAFLVSVVFCVALYIWINRTQTGLTLRAVAVAPESAGLVGINVPNTLALAFALGGAVTAAGGASLSMFLTFDASVGVIFTMKALIIVIMGGVRAINGVIISAFILGFVETAVATLIDPGLTLAAAYLLFIFILLFKPQGLFGGHAS
ncbi:MAG: branched-chain amino acid ABC transporter permease [SAR324 cluster bacterium]|nr:branched-chain amino acid ABC transporter permease [SAR324 cluster bacterium]